MTSRLDGYQRRHRWLGFPLAVVYKYVDDQGGYLAALITYYGFLSLFPLLLLLVTGLGFLLHGSPSLQQDALRSALDQFPIIGEQIGRDIHAIHGSVAAVVVGIVASLYGGLGIAQATQNAMNIAWAVPRNSRPNPIMSRLRSLGVLALFGVGLAATTALSALTTAATGLTDGILDGVPARLGAIALAVALNTALFIAAFRGLPARNLSVRQVRGGALAAAVGWQILQTLGTYVVSHQLRTAGSYYGVFGVVLGLIAFLYLTATLVVGCVEAIVVRTERLWPRSLLTPFTDDVALTEPDRRAYTSYATAQRAKGFERINTEFDPAPSEAAPDGTPGEAGQDSTPGGAGQDSTPREAGQDSTPGGADSGSDAGPGGAATTGSG